LFSDDDVAIGLAGPVAVISGDDLRACQIRMISSIDGKMPDPEQMGDLLHPNGAAGCATGFNPADKQ